MKRLLCGFVLLLLVAQPTMSADLTWDISPGTVGPGDGTITGGSGTWDTTGTNGVWTSDDGVNNVAWTNGNSATFQGTGGAVSIGSAVSASMVTVDSVGYTFTTANTLTLTSSLVANESTSFANNLFFGGPASVTVAPTKTMTISGNATGNSTLAVGGGGTLAVSGTSKFSGLTQLNVGADTTVSVLSGFNAFGTASSFVVTIAGGTLTADAPTNNAHNLRAGLTLQGATLTSINGMAGPANDGNFGNWVVRAPVVSGSAPSVINSTTLAVASAVGESVFTVNDVTGDAGVDLLVASRVILSTTAITKNGTGTMRLTGNNTYGGATTINAGTLLVSNTAGSGVGTNDVTINGGTLGGTGLLGTAGNASNVAFGANGGAIAPGESAGVLAVYGDVNFTSAGSSTFAVELNGLTVGSQYDQLIVNSATGGTDLINLGNATLAVVLGFTPDVNDQFTILLNNTPSSITNTFNGLANNSEFAVGLTTFRINYDAGTGNDVVLTVTAVPEPATLALLAAGALAICVLRRRNAREAPSS